MLNVPKDTHHSQIVLYNDDQTPWQFVVDLLQSVFGKTETEARAFATKIETQGEAICGSYPPKVAEALLQAAQDRIEADRHSLVIACYPMNGLGETHARCSICGAAPPPAHILHRGAAGSMCNACANVAASRLTEAVHDREFKYIHTAITWHFAGIPKDQLVNTSRRFPGHMRPDVQAAINALFPAPPNRFFGSSRSTVTRL